MTEIETRPQPSIALPRHVGQGTAVEQSRAVAEVAAAVQVARQFPRSTAQAVQQMREACAQPGLAEMAQFSYRRAGSNISGPTIHLAKELARCWSNMHYGVTELIRDDEHGQSEMMSWAWDLESNMRASTTVIVPHVRDANGKKVPLVTNRDIYENNANDGARRLRAQILGVLPKWFVTEAEDLCAKTLRSPKDAAGREIPMAQRVASVIQWFSEAGVSREQLETRQGRKADAWTPQDVANLGVVFRTLQRGETTAADEFPVERVTNAEVQRAAGQAKPPPAPEVQDPPYDPNDPTTHPDFGKESANV
jgi:hypothetical protein